MYRHILISTDGSEFATRGLDQGLSLARALGAAGTVVTVSEPFRLHPDGRGFDFIISNAAKAEIADGDLKAATEILAGARKSAQRLGIKVETLHVPDAEAAETILETAKARGCDLIVMGAHGRHGIHRLVLGSRTSEVLARSPVAVLVVR